MSPIAIYASSLLCSPDGRASQGEVTHRSCAVSNTDLKPPSPRTGEISLCRSAWGQGDSACVSHNTAIGAVNSVGLRGDSSSMGWDTWRHDASGRTTRWRAHFRRTCGSTPSSTTSALRIVLSKSGAPRRVAITWTRGVGAEARADGCNVRPGAWTFAALMANRNHVWRDCVGTASYHGCAVGADLRREDLGRQHALNQGPAISR